MIAELSLAASLLAGRAFSHEHSLAEVRAVIAKADADARRPSRTAAQGVKILLDNGFAYEPWMLNSASRVQNRYGLGAFSILARNFRRVNEDVLSGLAQIDNPYSLKAFAVVADRYAAVYGWQTRWLHEVHTPRALAAVRRVVRAQHNEKDLAQAALIDGLAGDDARPSGGYPACKTRQFETLVTGVLDDLPPSCGARLNGSDVLLHRWRMPDEDDDRVVRFLTPRGRGRGRLSVNMGSFCAFYAPDDAETLERLVLEELRCFYPPDLALRVAVAPAGSDLRDAPSGRPSRRSPRIRIAREAPLAPPQKRDVTSLFTSEMEKNVASPAPPPAAAPAAGPPEKPASSKLSPTPASGLE